MAIYHCSIKNIGRSSGKSAVASSAYRSGEKLHDEEQGKTFDYTSKDNVVYSEIIICKNAPMEYADRQTLWNEVQKVERAKDSRLAREWEVAIPNELDLEKAKELIRGYSQTLADEGMCVDFAIHWKEGNHHAHIMGTTRTIDENGAWGKKERKVYALDENGNKIPLLDENGNQKVRVREGKGAEKLWVRETVQANEWNKAEKVEEWRERWAEHCNRYLEQEHQVDHRSYKRQGVEQVPTIHEGYVARQMEQRGQVSERCEYNREVKNFNDRLREFIQTIKERLHEQITKFRGMERNTFDSRKTAERNRIVEVRARARRQIDSGADGRNNEPEGTAPTIPTVDNQAQQRMREVDIRNQSTARRKRKSAEIERDIEQRKPRIAQWKEQLEEKARDINERLAKYRRTVGSNGTARQTDSGITEPTLTDRAREQLRTHRGTNADNNQSAIRELQIADTDKRIAELKRSEEIQRGKEKITFSRNQDRGR